MKTEKYICEKYICDKCGTEFLEKDECKNHEKYCVNEIKIKRLFLSDDPRSDVDVEVESIQPYGKTGFTLFGRQYTSLKNIFFEFIHCENIYDDCYVQVIYTQDLSDEHEKELKNKLYGSRIEELEHKRNNVDFLIGVLNGVNKKIGE